MAVRFWRSELVWVLGIGRQGISAPLNIASFRDATALQREGFGLNEIRCYLFGVVQKVGRLVHNFLHFFIRQGRRTSPFENRGSHQLLNVLII